MITNALLYVVYGIAFIVTAPLRVLPDVTVNSNVATPVAWAIQNIALFNAIIPVVTIMEIFGLTMAIFIGVGVYRVFILGKSFIPTMSG